MHCVVTEDAHDQDDMVNRVRPKDVPVRGTVFEDKVFAAPSRRH